MKLKESLEIGSGRFKAWGQGKEGSMKVEDAGKRRPMTAIRKAVPFLTISVITIMAVAMAAGGVMIPQRSTIRFTGIVSDSVCGGDHGIMAAGDPECTRACVQLGAEYALMVGKLKVGRKMYLLRGHAADLDRFAGEEVRVKGRTLGRDTIIVDQVDRSYSEAAAAMN
jgi:hypothetical protein